MKYVISKHLKKDRETRKNIDIEGKASQAVRIGKKTKFAALAMAFIMLSPLSTFASSSTSATTSETKPSTTSESKSVPSDSQSATTSTSTSETKSIPVSESESEYRDWGRKKGIEIAVDNGKAIELNKVFEYGDHKIKLENAVWEDDSLLVTFSTLDEDTENTFVVSQFSLVNEEGVSVSNGHGMENNGDGSGIIDFDLENKFVKGEKLYLNIYTIRSNRPDDDKPDYIYHMILDKSLSTEGNKYDLKNECKTDYGTLKLKTASNEEGRLVIDYTFETLPEVEKLTNYDLKTRIHFNVFPEISLTDANKTFRANGRSSEGNGKTGKLYFDGMPELNRPIKISIECSEKLVNWKLDVPVKRTLAENISINKEFKSEDGIFKLKDLHLGAARTSLDFEFIPQNYTKINSVEPEIVMNFRGSKIPGSARYGDLTGKIDFNYPISEKDLADTTFTLYSVGRNIQCNEGIKVEFGKTPSYNLKVDGSEIVISNMVVKDGKTCFDIGTNDAKRKFTDFGVEIKSDKNHMSWSSTSSYSEYDSRFEELDGKGENSDNSDLNKLKKPIVKSFKVDGEHKSLEITVNTLTYTDIYNSEIKLK